MHLSPNVRTNGRTDSRQPIADSPSLNLATAVGTAARLLAGHGVPLDEIERLMRRQVLRQVIENKHGNLCHAALALGLHRNTMTRHVNELQLGAEVAEIRRREQRIGQKIGQNREASAA